MILQADGAPSIDKAPHCHVEWQGKSASVRVPDLVVFARADLDGYVRDLLIRRLDEVIKGWLEANEA